MSQSTIDRTSTSDVLTRGPVERGGRRKVVLITGASSGLGAEMARQLAGRGYDLALCARRTDRLAALATEIKAAHPQTRVETRALDVRDEDQVREVFRSFAQAFEGVDRIIANAGVGGGAPIGKGASAENRETLVTNVLGTLTQCEVAMELFRAQGGGHLVLVASMAAMRGLPGQGTAYAASKAAVAFLAEGLRSEMLAKPHLNIRVTTIFPGFIRSEMTEGLQVRFMADTTPAVREMVAAIEAERPTARIPAWPWRPLGTAMRTLPLSVVRRLT